MESSIDVVKEIKNKLVAAREPGVDKSKIQEEITQLQDQLKSISSSSSFSGENWLQATVSNGAGELKNVTKQIVGSFIRDAAGNVSVKTVNVDLSRNTVLFDTSSGAAKDKQGVLDSYAYFSSTGSYKLFEITNDSDGVGAAQPVTKVAAAKVYTEAQLKGLKEATAGTPVTFTTAAATGIVTIANADATVPDVNGTYFNLGNDQYVKINTTAPTSPATKTNIAVGLDGTTKIYLEEGATAQLATQLTYSLTSLDITKDLTGTFKNSDGSAVSENQYLDAMVSFVDKQLQSMTSAAADLGSVKMRIELQENFVNKLTDSLDKGIGRLVDAEMNEESTKLKALQTQQQLAVQALSIANNDSQSILSLFR